MEDLDGVSVLLSLPAASARPWSKARLDRLGTGCQGKSKARHGAGWVVGQETLDILVPCTGTPVVEAPLLTSSS